MTSSPTTNPWKISSSHSGLITLGPTTHFHASITGPPRQPGQPLTIIIPGLSASPQQWVAVARLASSFTRVLLYSRSGYGLSSPPANPISAISIASELSSLLQTADLQGPFVLIAHSWGGIIARELLYLRNEDVAGLVMVDANQEINTTEDPWPAAYVSAMAKGLDIWEVTGSRESHRLREEEWRAFEEEEGSERHARVAAAEFEGYRDSGPTLARKKQLEAETPVMGMRSVSVLAGRAVRDFERMWEEGLKRGNGTVEERRLFREMLEAYQERDDGWQRATMRLSGKSRWRVAENSGHHVHFTEPEVIIEELKWVVENLA